MDKRPAEYPIKTVWSLPLTQVYEQLHCSQQAEADTRLYNFGPNRIQLQSSRSVWAILLAQLKSLIFRRLC